MIHEPDSPSLTPSSSISPSDSRISTAASAFPRSGTSNNEAQLETATLIGDDSDEERRDRSRWATEEMSQSESISSSGDTRRPTPPPSCLGDLHLSRALYQMTDIKFPFLDKIELNAIHHVLKGAPVVSVRSFNDERHISFIVPFVQHFIHQPSTSNLFGCIIVYNKQSSFHIEKEIKGFQTRPSLRALRMVAGKTGEYAMDAQVKAFTATRPHVVIATIGRLADHLSKTARFNLRQLKFLAVYEADRILSTSASWGQMERILKASASSTKILVSSERTSEVRRLESRAMELREAAPDPEPLTAKPPSPPRPARAGATSHTPRVTREPRSSLNSMPDGSSQESQRRENADEEIINLSNRLHQACILKDGNEERLLNELCREPQLNVDMIHQWLEKHKRDPAFGHTLKLLVRLAEKTKTLPTGLFLRKSDITLNSQDLASHGSFSNVFRGRYMQQEVALKCLRVLNLGDGRSYSPEDIRRRLSREALAWYHADHPNILPLIGIDKHSFPNQMCLVSQWLQWGNIMSFLQVPSSGYSPRTDRNRLLMEVASGLAYLHQYPDIVHGDLHTGNILIDNQRSARLMDLGLASIGDASQAGTVATVSVAGAGATQWLAPELLNPNEDHHPRSKAADVFAFGRLIVAITTKQQPFGYMNLSSYSIMDNVYQDKLKPHLPTAEQSDGEPLTAQMWELAERCWEREPFARPSMSEIVEDFESGALGPVGSIS